MIRRRVAGPFTLAAPERWTTAVCWNLIAIAPRLAMSEGEATAVAARLACHLYNDPSRIVRTASLEGLATLAIAHPSVRRDAKRFLTAALDDVSPSLRARARQLLKRGDVRRALATAEP